MYDVADPVHPRLLCRIQWTSAHLSSSSGFMYLDPRSATQTDIALRSFSGIAESRAGELPGWITNGAWLSNGSLGAYTVRLDPTGTCGAGATQVWTYEQGSAQLLATYCDGFGDCICRFGLPAPILALSPDGQYLAEGWLAGKGSEAMGVYRLADRVRVATLPQDTDTAFWDRGSDRLFVVSNTSVQAWTPNTGTLSGVSGANQWSFYPNMSPDGRQVVYTAFSDAVQGTQPRVYLYDLATAKARMLIDQPRSQVVFVKDGWVWDLEEQFCSDCPNNTQPTDKIFAMNLSTGAEQSVTFAAGEALSSSYALLPGEFWPSS